MKKPKPWMVTLYTICGCSRVIQQREEPPYSILVQAMTDGGYLLRTFRVDQSSKDMKKRTCRAYELIEAPHNPAPHPGGGTEGK